MHEVFKLRKGCRCIQKAVYITCELIVNDYVRNRPKLSLFTDSFPSSELVKPDNHSDWQTNHSKWGLWTIKKVWLQRKTCSLIKHNIFGHKCVLKTQVELLVMHQTFDNHTYSAKIVLEPRANKTIDQNSDWCLISASLMMHSTVSGCQRLFCAHNVDKLQQVKMSAVWTHFTVTKTDISVKGSVSFKNVRYRYTVPERYFFLFFLPILWTDRLML